MPLIPYISFIVHTFSMKLSTPLPTPSEEEINHSNKLVKQIIDEIKQADNHSISFRRFMEMALYQPSLGYYVAGKKKLGQQGDFTTAPEVSPLYSRCIAQQCQQVLGLIESADILEFGAGSGTMAAEILRFLDEQSSLPEHYYILEVSPDLIALQKQRFLNEIPHLVDHIVWLSSLPKAFEGIMLANEVLDAMPVDLFTINTNEIHEQRVSLNDEAELISISQPASSSLAATIKALKIETLASSYTSEINPHITPWIHSVSDSLKKGVILLIDYGYTRKEYYQPDRSMGTLLCYYQHRMHDNYLYYPGLQDITSNVDFTAIAEAADNTDLSILGFASQSTFLVGCGLENHLMQVLEKSPDSQYHLAQQVRTLSLPSEMGERFKVIAMGRDINKELIGFTMADYCYKL